MRARRLKSSESVHRYVIEMQEMAAHANIPETELIDLIVSGIGDPSNLGAMLYGATSMNV